jgi:biopolymer transport protein ExbB
VALITPLIGLLGTVTGLIKTFVIISSNSGLASTTELSGGIYQSLLTTAAGLVVAIPAFAAYSYLSSRVNALMREMERGGIEVVGLITTARETEEGAQIIDFKATRRARSAE